MTDNTPTASPLPPLDLDVVMRLRDFMEGKGWAPRVTAIDALLARALTPEEASLGLTCIEHSAYVVCGMTIRERVLAIKLGQIAGDR